MRTYSAIMKNGNMTISEQWDDGIEQHALKKSIIKVCESQIKKWLSYVCDEQGRPTAAQTIMDHDGEIAIDEETYHRLALVAILSTSQMDRLRILVLVNRLDRFSREECAYWLSKCSTSFYGQTGKRWAISGLRMMLCGGGEREETQQVLYGME